MKCICSVMVDGNDTIWVCDCANDEDGNEVEVWFTALRQLTLVGSSYVVTTIIPINSGISSGGLSTFTVDGDLIVYEDTEAPDDQQGMIAYR